MSTLHPLINIEKTYLSCEEGHAMLKKASTLSSDPSVVGTTSPRWLPSRKCREISASEYLFAAVDSNGDLKTTPDPVTDLTEASFKPCAISLERFANFCDLRLTHFKIEEGYIKP